MTRAPAASVAILLALISDPALAYECTATTESQGAITQHWRSHCIPFYINCRGELFQNTAIESAVIESFRAWSTQACTDIEFRFGGYTDDQVGFDGQRASDNKNVISGVESEEEFQRFNDPNLLAITIATYSVESGEILDADILIDNLRHEFSVVADAASCSDDNDFQNMLVHEMGHFIGFEHNDNMDSTMFPSAPNCETKKRDLTDDDRQGLCTLYPSGMPGMTCRPPPGGYEIAGVEPYRNQCARVAAPVDTTCNCACKGGGGCGCTVERSGPGVSGVVLFLLVVLGALIARRATWR